MARPDRRAVLILVVLGAAGALVRLLAGPSGAPGAVAYHPAAAPRSTLDSVAARAGRLTRPLRRGETIDLDRASAEDITRLPRIGPGLAARIVADRDANGPFGSLEGLDRVSGIGPSVIAAVKPYATFSGRRIDGATDRRFVDSEDAAASLIHPRAPAAAEVSPSQGASNRRTAEPSNRQGGSGGGRKTGEPRHRPRAKARPTSALP